jgi:signal transduction histidine kinase
VKDKLKKTYESAERLIRLVDALLDLSHIESGKIRLEMKKMDLAKMAASVVEELAPEAEEKNINLKFKNPGREYFILGDEEKLRQVVMNLIDNAIKYTKQGEVTVYFEEKDKSVRLTVKDTGMGMRREEIGSLFQKFVRGSEAAHYHTEGTGIGLYVAKRLLEEQDGEIGAASQGEGRGSEFFIMMPLYQEKNGIISSVKNSISSKGQKIAGRLKGLVAR